eukprot:4460090-Karenia_brevis.AAC.1
MSSRIRPTCNQLLEVAQDPCSASSSASGSSSHEDTAKLHIHQSLLKALNKGADQRIIIIIEIGEDVISTIKRHT